MVTPHLVLDVVFLLFCNYMWCEKRSFFRKDVGFGQNCGKKKLAFIPKVE